MMSLGIYRMQDIKQQFEGYVIEVLGNTVFAELHDRLANPQASGL